jgi:type IV pilus assembly protein PilM
VISLGGSSVLIKKVAIPTASDVQFDEQVYYEAEQHFQMDMADLYYDHARIGPVTPEGTTPVLLIGAKRELVEQHIACLKKIGMRPGVIECDVFSVANMFEYNYGVIGGLIAIVNVGCMSTTVSLISNGEYLYTRDVPIAGEEYSRRIVEVMGVDRGNAEALKISSSQGDGNVPPELTRVLNDINDQLVSEIKVTVDFYFQSGEAPASVSGLNYLFLTGGGCRILGLDAALAATLQLPVQVINPFQRIDVNPRRFQTDYLLLQGHLYGVAVGLGMRTMRDN